MDCFGKVRIFFSKKYILILDMQAVESAMQNKGKIGLIVGVALIVIITIYIIVLVSRKAAKISTPSTVKNMQRDRTAILNNLIEPTIGKKTGLFDVPLPDNQDLLLNYNVMGCRLAGYLDPLQDGVFDEENAVRLGLATGCRLFIIEISHGPGGQPALVARDGMGYKRSLNEGSVAKVMSALATGSTSGEPLIVVLYFHDAPDKSKNPGDYLNFLSLVAKALTPLIPNHLGLTSVGDFTRQKKEVDLFTYGPEFYRDKVLILCNVDTSAFRNPAQLGVTRTFSPNEDLDFFVHCRLYKADGGGELGLTEAIGSGSTGHTAPKALLADDSYFLLTPPDRVGSVVDMTRNTFVIVMKKDPSYVPSDEQADLLLNKYGIQCIPLGLDSLSQSSFPATWAAKNIALRFTKPQPIVPTVPNPKLDANGGSIVSPQI